MTVRAQATTDSREPSKNTGAEAPTKKLVRKVLVLVDGVGNAYWKQT